MTKIVFMGTPEFSVNVLKELLNNKDYEVVAVVSQPDKKVGRRHLLTPSPISELAIENNIPLLRLNKIKEEYQKVIEYKPDIIITCAYGQIIPVELLNYPIYGCINVHASLLPELRGGSPIHTALIKGYKKTGITIMYMDKEMDTGDIISQEETIITDEDNLETLNNRLSTIGSKLLIKTLKDIVSKTAKRIKQDSSKATYAYNIKREEEKIDFTRTTREIFNQVRGLYKNPAAYFLLDNKIVKVYEGYINECKDENIKPGQIINIYKNGIGIKTKDGEYVVTRIKPEGKKEIDVKDYLNGVKKENLLNKICE